MGGCGFNDSCGTCEYSRTCRDAENRRVVIVTRHAGAVEWLRRRGVEGEVVSSLDETNLPDRQDVYGVLPLTLAVELLRRQCRVFVIQFPPRGGPRGAELTADEMSAGGAKLYRFGLQAVGAWSGQAVWVDGAAYAQPDDDASTLGAVRIALEEV